ncbi:MAG: hypothetical protein WAJ99_06070 [Candidatus Sulfotelmatobacter sp.]
MRRGRTTTGAKAPSGWKLYAALKRRSSTALHGFVTHFHAVFVVAHFHGSVFRGALSRQCLRWDEFFYGTVCRVALFTARLAVWLLGGGDWRDAAAPGSEQCEWTELLVHWSYGCEEC